MLALALLGAACPDDDDEPDASSSGSGGCRLGYLGERGQDISLQVTAMSPGGESAPLEEGGDVTLVFPPQGGRVAFIGVRATNVDPCGARLSGAIRDPATGQVRLDARTINLKPFDGGGGGSVDGVISTFANIPLCPNQWASTALYDHPFELTLSLRERGTNREAQHTMTVTPRCNEQGQEEECLCICRAGYVLGERCGRDGGVEDASARD